MSVLLHDYLDLPSLLLRPVEVELEILAANKSVGVISCSELVAHQFLILVRAPARALLLQVTPTDGLPELVCGQCRDQLDGFYRFRENALTVERRLKEYLAKQQLTTYCSEVSGV